MCSRIVQKEPGMRQAVPQGPINYRMNTRKQQQCGKIGLDVQKDEG